MAFRDELLWQMSFADGQLTPKAILEFLMCPVCQETLKPPVVQCKKGHLMCREHIKTMSKCPTCRAKFSNITPAVFNQALGNNVQPQPVSRRCNHPGCSEVVTIGDDHELWCGYRPTLCLYDNTDHNCPWTGRVMKLRSHVKKDHKDFNRCYDNAPSSIDNISLSTIDITKHTGWGEAHDCFFWIEAEMNSFKHSFVLKVTMVPIRRPTGVFHAWVEFRSKTSKLCMAVELDLDPNTDYPEKNSVKVHTDVLRDSLKMDDRLWYKLHIGKDDVREYGESFL